MTPRPSFNVLALAAPVLVVPVLVALALAGCVRVSIHGDPGAADPRAGDTVEAAAAEADAAAAPPAPLRVATYNTSLNDDADGGLVRRLAAGDPAARAIATMLQRVHPDLVLLNEFDYDAEGRAADLFQRDYLERAQRPGLAPLRYPYRYLAPVNTGVPSGLDLDGNGTVATSGRAAGDDAWGFGLHPGQYGMLVLSKYPIDTAAVRSFRLLRWSAMPDAARPLDPRARRFFHTDAVWNALRLSSKSHWDVPVRTPLGRVHFLVAHPTPPVFDGPEDRNGARNADELRLWRAYLDDAPADRAWLCDDAGRCGGLAAGERFVIAGDMNNDPIDGDGRHDAILALIGHPRVSPAPAPRSAGAAEAARRAPAANAGQRGDPAEDTGDFGPKVGDLRLDYVLPSANLRVLASGVDWPTADDPDAAAANASDHHPVWVDLLPATTDR